MSNAPIITFKAGACDFDTTTNPSKVIPKPTPGYLYLFDEDELVHFCWRPRSASSIQPELDLTMFPTDGTFTPYEPITRHDSSKSPTNGRIFILKFQSSTQRHFFWLQSKSQNAQGDPAWFSPRDLKLGQIVNRLLQGDEVNVEEEIANVPTDHGGNGDDDNDSTSNVEDLRPEGQATTPEDIASGNPFLGDSGEEGQSSRGSGVDGRRAAAISYVDPAIAVQNFLRSIQGNPELGIRNTKNQSIQIVTLQDLLPTALTLKVIDEADAAYVNNLLGHIPSTLPSLSHGAEVSTDSIHAALLALNLDEKKAILRKVLRSPQFFQSLSSLTIALRDGGLPIISDALRIPVQNGGFVSRNGGLPIGGADAVNAFLDGVKAAVKKENGKA